MIIREDCSLPRVIKIENNAFKVPLAEPIKLEHISDFDGFGIYEEYARNPLSCSNAIVCCDKNCFPYIILIPASYHWTYTRICEIISRYNHYGKFNIKVNKYFNAWDDTYYYQIHPLGQYVI